MPSNRKSVTMYTDLAADLWADAFEDAREDVPIEDPREGQVLAWILGEYLDREIVAVTTQSKGLATYHLSADCPNLENGLRLYDRGGNGPNLTPCSYCEHGGQLGNILRRNGGEV